MKDPHTRPFKASQVEDREAELARNRERALAKLRSQVANSSPRASFNPRSPDLLSAPSQTSPLRDSSLVAMSSYKPKSVSYTPDPDREPRRPMRVRPQDEYEVFEGTQDEIQENVEEFADIMYDYMMLIINPDYPPSIKIETTQRGYRLTYAICESEYGKVKGRHGTLITSIQTLARALGGKLRQEIEVILLTESALELVYTKGPLFEG